MFHPDCLLRRKLILLAAILEHSGAFHRDFTAGGPGRIGAAVVRMGTTLAVFALSLSAGILLFAPRRLLGRR